MLSHSLLLLVVVAVVTVIDLRNSFTVAGIGLLLLLQRESVLIDVLSSFEGVVMIRLMLMLQLL